MKRISIATAVSLILAGITFPLQASAANNDGICDIGPNQGDGTSGNPWLIDSEDDLLEVGSNDCAGNFAGHQNYRLTANIALTAPWVPVTLTSANPIMFDGDGYVISGLNITAAGVGGTGLFASVSNTTIKDLYITGSSITGGNFTGAITGIASGSTIENVYVTLSGAVTGLQLTGGLVGKAQSGSTLRDLVFRGTTVFGTSYCGGAVGSLEASSITRVAAQTNTDFSNIGGGLIGSWVPDGAATADQLFVQGSVSADQFIGGLVGYLWSPGSHAVTITNSGVSGEVKGKAGNSLPAMFIGEVGNGISALTISRSYSKGNQFKNGNQVLGADAAAFRGSPITFTGTNNILGSGHNVSTVTAGHATVADVANPGVLTAQTWRHTSSASPNPANFDWNVLPTALGGWTALLPVPAFTTALAHLATPCPVGFFSPSGLGNCNPAPAGRFIATTGATVALQCPAGTYQNQIGQAACIPAQPGFFVANAGSITQDPCAAGTTSLATSATFCTPVAAAGYSGPMITTSGVSVRAGSTVNLLGAELSSVTGATIDGVPAVIVSKSSTSITLRVPEVSAGAKDLILSSGSGTLTVQGALRVVEGDALTTQTDAVSIKRIGNRVRLFATDVVGAGKIQFKINGKEVGWVRAVDETNPKLRNANGRAYFVRLAGLASGKNAVEIYVDGTRVKRAAYTR